MKRLLRATRVLGAVLTVLLTTGLARAQGIRLSPHEKLTLKNGLTVLLLEKHGVPMVNFNIIVKSGSTADPIGQEGLAAITAGLLRKGTKTRTAQQFAADLDYIGASFEVEASADFTTAAAEFLTKDLDKGLELVKDGLLHPTFPQAEVDKLLAQSLDGIRAAKDDPQQVLGTYYYAYLYGPRAYGRPENGDEISLKSIQRAAIVKFYETNYVPGNVILAVAGEFKSEQMKKKLEDSFGAWQSKPAPAQATDKVGPVRGKRLLLVDKPDSTQTYFAFGNVATAAGDPDRFAIRVVNTVFGGRFTSMLNEALRVESGLTYGVQSVFDPRKAPGPFGIYSFTKNETTARALEMALEVLAKLHKDGLTAEQLASAKSYIKGQFPPRIETAGQLARQIAIDEFYGLGDDEVNQLEARVDAVTPEIAKQVIQKHFPAQDLVFVLIGKAIDIKAAAQKYAEKQDMRTISEPGFWPPKK